MDEFSGKAQQLTAKMPTGLVLTAEDRDLWDRVFAVLAMPGIVLRRKLRVLPEQFDGRRVEPGLLQWLLGLVGFDDSQALVGLLDTDGRRTLARQAPALFSERGNRAAFRRAAQRGGPYPALVLDWIDLRTVVDVSGLPMIATPAAPAGAYRTDVHIPEPDPAAPVDREVAEELIRLNMGLSETTVVRYVRAFDNGQNGAGQWTPAGALEAAGEAPHYLSADAGAATAWLASMQPDAADYVAWFAVTPTDSATLPRMYVYGDPAGGTGYRLRIVPSASGNALWELSGAAALASGLYPWAGEGNTYLVQIATYTDTGGVRLTVTIDGDELCDVLDPTSYRTAGVVGFDTLAGGCDLEFVHVHNPADTTAATVEHHDLIK